MRVIIGTVIEDSKEEILCKIRNLKYENVINKEYLQEVLSVDNPIIGNFSDYDVNDKHLEEFFKMCGGLYLSEGWGKIDEEFFLGDYCKTYTKVEE